MWHTLQNLQFQFALGEKLFGELAHPDDPNTNHCAKKKRRDCLESVVTDFLLGGGDLNSCHGLYLPLHFAALRSNFTAVNVLLNHGAKPWSRDGLGRTAIHCAAAADFRCLRRIYDAIGANSDASSDKTRETHVGNRETHVGNRETHVDNRETHVGIRETHVGNRETQVGNKSTHSFVEKCINAKDLQGRTPLHCAVSREKTRNVGFLLMLGAFIDVANSSGFTAVHMACKAGNAKVLRILLNFNPDLQSTNHINNTPIDLCTFDLILARRRQNSSFSSSSERVNSLTSLQDKVQCWRLLSRASPTSFFIPSRFNSRSGSRDHSTNNSGTNSHNNSRSNSRGNSRRASVVRLPLNMNGNNSNSNCLWSSSSSSSSSSPRNLQDFCRLVIRASFRPGEFIPFKLDQLDLPTKIRDFLLLKS